MYSLSLTHTLLKNYVPGVMTLESNFFLVTYSSNYCVHAPAALNLSRRSTFLPEVTYDSNAALNLLDLCWFILARGATPSIAKYNVFRGRTIFISLSIY